MPAFSHMVEMNDPTPEQIAEWRAGAERTMKEILAGEYDYPNPDRERIEALEARVAALESFLVI